MASGAEIADILGWCDAQLKQVVDFWLTKSIDLKNGGYYNCLSSTGEIYDKTKYGWLQGRQVWMFSKLYNEVSEYHRPDVLDAAVHGGEFLMRYIKVKNQMRCYFAVSEVGLPVKLQRKPYTECFYIIGLYELYRATCDETYKTAAEEMLQQLIYCIRFDDSTSLGLVRLAGAPQTRELARPLMLLHIILEICGDNEELRKKYWENLYWCGQTIMQYDDGEWIHEHVLLTGGYPDGCDGRLGVPGHAIEGGWFLLQEGLASNNERLKDAAIKQFIEKPFEYGWDKEYGGLYYFLDKENNSPLQLEWNMKLWWVHCEAMIASLMAYKYTEELKHWELFKKVLNYVMKHFPDNENGGEWFGYLTREGKVNQSFKGGPFKGCYHTPRCLMMCRKMLLELQSHK